jgi:hypothetical protein
MIRVIGILQYKTKKDLKLQAFMLPKAMKVGFFPSLPTITCLAKVPI